MDHKDLIASLPAETKDRLQRRSNSAGLNHLLIYLAALAALSAAILAQIPFWPVLVLPQGVLLVFLFTLSHECTHKTPFRTGWLNDAVGHLVSVPIALPFTWFRYFHLAHHKWTNDPKRDPELDGKPRPDNWPDLMIYLSGWTYWSGMAKVLVQNARGHLDAPYLPKRQHKAMKVEARILLGLYALTLISLTYSTMLFWVWLLPVLVAQPVLRLYLLAEHGLCPPVANMLENSRTTFTNRALRFLAWNMPYHAEHHSFPNVPFHHLPELHDWTRAHLKSTSTGYTEFTKDYARTLNS
ncbi:MULTISPECIES: fatty acid desaturase [unclassified Ruegeria]|uniref:fatty acid desaturase n=1 Tax=unclassified Ruegeria TaxID=2625375 RepID=UPI001490C9CB|nr:MULTISPECIES: fatty acid desaturase [unclassified Ruegeria]NOD78067.1 fatty acid desaturase [Ruegeria sp. HKCCD4332]NOD87651.1 fatty acid desaturase [Ruegeria sp. HKCCD4318]NOE15684.1 fatty acid desaturase [Ruegeria sp. HKCCD4318-2]NOG08624.1 fatty acid desaturase [Ruegeria sp. HKCCD4315]